jgi:hypothetical protein
MSPQAHPSRIARTIEGILNRLQPEWVGKTSEWVGKSWAGQGAATGMGKTVAARRLASAVPRLVTASLGLLTLATAAYAATILFGLVRGHALPTATFSFLVDPMGWVQGVDRWLPYGLILIAAVGAAASWFVTSSHGSGPPGSGQSGRDGDARKLRRCEFRLMLGWRWLGWLVVPAILLFGISSGGWSGVARMSDQHYPSLFGLVPYTDAAGYHFTSLNQAMHGEWIQFGSRRPVSQALRDASLALGGLSYERVLVLQTVLLGLALSFAGLRLAAWRGAWAGLAFVGLMILQVRALLPTMMTEPLGMIVALVGVALLIDSIRHRSTSHALLAVTALALALSVRMGALFVLPILVVWTAFAIAPPERRWTVLAAGTALVACVIGLGRILSMLYAPPGALAGGNFALTLCGLSVGSDWSACQYRLYARELAAFVDDEAGAASWTLRQALRNIADQPSTFVLAIAGNIGRYIGGFARFYVHGYAGKPYFSHVVVVLASLACIPGIVFCLRRRASRTERLLWAGVFAAIAVSAAIIMRDNGWRALHVTHALTVVFLALAFAAPGVLTTRGAALSVRRWSMALACGVLLLILAPRGLQAVHARDVACCQKPAIGNTLDHVIGGQRLTGFVIVPDGTVRNPKVPSIPLGDFERIFRATYSKDADVEGIMTIVRQRAPVAFVDAQPLTASPRESRDQRLPPVPVMPDRLAMPTTQVYLLAPPEILHRRDVRYWKLERDAMRTIPGPFMTVYDVGWMSAVP